LGLAIDGQVTDTGRGITVVGHEGDPLWNSRQTTSWRQKKKGQYLEIAILASSSVLKIK
jgi:hypothetical protein